MPMIRLARPWTILAVACAAAAIAVAGCSAQPSVASSPAALSVAHSPEAYSTHSPKPRRTHSPKRRRTHRAKPHRKHSPKLRRTQRPKPRRTYSLPSASPTHTPTTATSTTTSSPSPSQSVCVTSEAQGLCKFGPYGPIKGASWGPQVGQDVWSPIPGWQQTLYATDPGNWYVVANMPAGNTGVVSFPDVGAGYSGLVSSYSMLTSSFTETMNATAGTNAEASYDIWFNDSGAVNEVMIQNDFSPGRVPSCPTWAAQNVQFGGSNGVPVHTWDLCQGDTTSWWVIADGNIHTGSVDVLAMVDWLIRHGYMASGSQFGSIGYGWEISSTGGADERFQVSQFSITAS